MNENQTRRLDEHEAGGVKNRSKISVFVGVRIYYALLLVFM